MQKILVHLLFVIACVTVVSADWFYYITYSDNNCTNPVAVQITGRGRWCDVEKRGVTDAQSYQCEALQGYDENYSIYYAPYCKGGLPELPETASLPVVITTYNAENCSVDPIQIHYFAKNYNGIFFGLTSWDSLDDQVIEVQTSCSNGGVLNATLCPPAQNCTDLLLTEECAFNTDSRLSLVQSGCVPTPLPPNAVPNSSIPSSSPNVNTPSDNTNSPTVNTNSKPASQTSNGTRGTSSLAAAAIICTVATFNLII